jgi:hypothetical protein
MRNAFPLVALTVAASTYAADQYDQQKAFNDGKAYSSANGGLKAGINDAAITNVPGQDASTTNQLKGMYGTNLAVPGADKANTCANYAPGPDAYKNQECETINFVVGNPAKKPVYTIDKTGDPLISKGTTISNTPQNYTGSTNGLSGTYSACKDKTTNLPAQYNTESCQIGRTVTESYCPTTLVVTYTWQTYSGQAGADLKYGHCNGSDVRGDQLSIPLTNSYYTTATPCGSPEVDPGSATLIWYTDCSGNTSLWGYNGSACKTPSVSDPPHYPIQACANAPRTIDNCFTPSGQFTTKATVPVFSDSVDTSQCADLYSSSATITN